jgi:hypothetical protein
MGVVTTVVGRIVVPLVGGTGVVAVVEDVVGKGVPVD